jgi:hypothetical protein
MRGSQLFRTRDYVIPQVSIFAAFEGTCLAIGVSEGVGGAEYEESVSNIICSEGTTGASALLDSDASL